MSVRNFELFHGAVLTKLVRTDRNMTLRLIETRTQDAGAVYTINDEVHILVKYSASPQPVQREEGQRWTFSFTPGQLRQLCDFTGAAGCHVALVCGDRDLNNATVQICLLDPDHVEKLIDLQSRSTQAVWVKYLPRKNLRVSSGHVTTPINIPQGRIDTWEVPGS